MEKEHQLTRRNFLKLSGAVASAVMFSGLVRKDASGITPLEKPDYSQLNFKPIEINYDNFETPSPASSSPEISLSPDEQRIQDLQNETAQYVQIAKESDKVSDKWINDLKMYGPIYIAAAEKFGIDWKMLWVTHEKESGASAKNSKAFDGSTYPYVGGMQRDPNVWPQSYVDEASKGLEYLEELPQRHEDDWKEIAGAARMLGANINKYKDLGEDKSVLNAFLLYSADEPAYKRFALYKKYQEIFEPDPSLRAPSTKNGCLIGFVGEAYCY